MLVALSGYYGFDNMGDEAILLAITRELLRLGHTPIVLSNTPRETEQTYGVEAVHRMRPLELWRGLSRAQALFSGGGGLLQDRTSQRTLQYYLGLIWMGRLLGKRVAVFNQSIGPLSTAGERSVGLALRGVRLITRDSSSQAYLERLTHRPVTLGGDPALLLTPSPGITRNESLVILAPRGGQPAATERLVLLAERLNATGRQVVALGVQPGTDTAELRAFANKPWLEVEEIAKPQQALDLIASAGAVVGVRLHALILAATAGTRFYGISYDPKVKAFCADAEAPVHPTEFNVDKLELELESNRTPNWNAIESMRERARASFTLALQ